MEVQFFPGAHNIMTETISIDDQREIWLKCAKYRDALAKAQKLARGKLTTETIQIMRDNFEIGHLNNFDVNTILLLGDHLFSNSASKKLW